MQRAVLALLWFAATALATGVSWLGVSAVTNAVSDSPATAIAPARVSELATTPTTAPLVDGLATTTTTAPSISTSVTRPPAPAPAPSTSASRPAPVAPPPVPTTAPPAPTATATFSTRGGSISVACRDASISLLSASPADGYRVDVHDSGPERVDVSFDAELAEGSQIVAHCESGQPVRDAAGTGDHESSDSH